MLNKYHFWWSLILLVAVMGSFNNLALATDDYAKPEKVGVAISKASQYLYRYHEQNKFSAVGDWSVIAWYSTGDVDSAGVINDKKSASLKKTLKAAPDSSLTTDIARFIIGQRISGVEPRELKAWLTKLQQVQNKSGKFSDDLELGGEKLVNAQVWSIIALCSSQEKDWNQAAAYKWLSQRQHQDGGFGYAVKSNSDVDVTASVIIALALLGKDTQDPIVTKCLDYIKTQQLAGGGWGSWSQENLESSALVLQALVSLQLTSPDNTWYGREAEIANAILKYQLPDGSFSHIKQGRSNLMATEQAILGLGDYLRGRSVYQKMMAP